MFSGQHPTSSRALVPALDQRCPAPFEPAADDVLASSFHDAGSDRAVRASGRGFSEFGPCWPRSIGCRPRRLRTSGGVASERL